MEFDLIQMSAGLLAGFAITYAFKKLFKFVLFVLGLYFLSLLVLEYVGYITVNPNLFDVVFDKLLNVFQDFSNFLQQKFPIAVSALFGSIIATKVR